MKIENLENLILESTTLKTEILDTNAIHTLTPYFHVRRDKRQQQQKRIRRERAQPFNTLTVLIFVRAM